MAYSCLITFFSCFASGVGLGFLIFVLPKFLLRVQNEAINLS